MNSYFLDLKKAISAFFILALILRVNLFLSVCLVTLKLLFCLFHSKHPIKAFKVTLQSFFTLDSSFVIKQYQFLDNESSVL